MDEKEKNHVIQKRMRTVKYLQKLTEVKKRRQ